MSSAKRTIKCQDEEIDQTDGDVRQLLADQVFQFAGRGTQKLIIEPSTFSRTMLTVIRIAGIRSKSTAGTLGTIQYTLSNVGLYVVQCRIDHAKFGAATFRV